MKVITKSKQPILKPKKVFIKNKKKVLKTDTFRNILEDVEIEKAKTKVAEQKYKQIFELSPDLIMLINDKGEILDVNNRIYDWTGYKPKEIIGLRTYNIPFLSITTKLKILKL